LCGRWARCVCPGDARAELVHARRSAVSVKLIKDRRRFEDCQNFFCAWSLVGVQGKQALQRSVELLREIRAHALFIVDASPRGDFCAELL
jgi:hypothetical protein